MFDFLRLRPPSLAPQQIARSCRWLGWGGFWLQALLGFLPLLVVVAKIFASPAQWPNSWSSLGLWLAIICLAVLLFSIHWCYRYTQLAARIEHPELRPAKSAVGRTLRIGLVANLSMMVLAVVIMLWRVSALTFKMLSVPQGATVVTPNQAAATLTPGALITPSNMIALQAMGSTIAAGLVGVIVALLLIYQVGRHRNSPDAFY
ncbi:MAG: DUF3611 family protein [Nodosilinea sp.]